MGKRDLNGLMERRIDPRKRLNCHAAFYGRRRWPPVLSRITRHSLKTPRNWDKSVRRQNHDFCPN